MKPKGVSILLLGDYSLDAIDYYLQLIERAVLRSFHITANRVYNIKDINKDDLVVTIDAKSFLKVWLYGKLKRLNLKIINWFQGVVPEEAYLVFKSRIRKFYWEVFERFCLRNADFKIFVSEAMKQHYSNKYSAVVKRYFIIPCYNKKLNESFFRNQERYENPNFVYAGSMSKWQCIEETLLLFEKIEERLPFASLTLLTKDKMVANKLLEKYAIKNINIKYTNVDELDLELAKYKYGFLIRGSNIVNYVATPTKMNSYLSAGTIPIFTDAVSDFKNLSLGRYSICLESQQSIDQWADNIIKFEIGTVAVGAEFLNSVKRLFNTYYNDEGYIEGLATRLSENIVYPVK